MIEPMTDRLYNLLPAIYRMRDDREGQSLRALFGILEQELKEIEQDVEGLYNNWFIETCDEWIVPYIGDLLKVPALHTGGFGTFSLRAYIANVLAYRRRKGTASVLEQMANDVTGWVARVVEFHKLLGTTQHVNHVRPENVRTPDLRDTNALELLGGPFERAAYAADVRSVAAGRGKYNIPNIGIFLWRLQSYWVKRSEASPPAEDPDSGRYTFNPLGADAPLFNRPQTETEITHIAEEPNVPAPLRRRPLYEELEGRRQAKAEGKEPAGVYYDEPPVFQIYVQQNSSDLLRQVPAEEIMICNLEGWQRPPTSKDYVLPDKTSVAMPITVAVDPVLGRLAFPDGIAPHRVEVSCAYGFSSDVGGGPYDRSESLVDLFKDERTLWWAGVSEKEGTGQNNTYKTIAEAVGQWNAQIAARVGVIAVMDNSTYQETLTGDSKITIPADRTLLIVAAKWRSGAPPAANPTAFDGDLNKLLVAQDLRPVLRGNIEVEGGVATAGEPGKLILNGLLIKGVLTVLAGELSGLALSHCTVVPAGKEDADKKKLIVKSAAGRLNEELTLTVERSICGAIEVPEHIKSLRIIDSVVDSAVDPDEAGYPAPAISAEGEQNGPATGIERSTIFGTVFVREITQATEAIFTETVTAVRLQAGCVRYSFVPLDSRAPRRFRCQPDLALAQRERELKNFGKELDTAERGLIEERLWPVFTSTGYGDPGYGQLSTACPEEIRTGAEEGSEMGAFCHLKQPQREANLRINLAEYLRFGMEAGIFYVN